MMRNSGKSETRPWVARLLGGGAELAPVALTAYAVVLGLLGGMAEALYLTIRQAIKHQPAAWYFPELLWMAPLAASLTLALLALGLSLLARWARAGVSMGKATFLFIFPGIYGVAQSRGIPLHPVAEVALSLGVAAFAARVAARRPASVARFVRRAALPMAAAVVALLAYGVATLPHLAERRALAGLPHARAGAANVLMIILDTVRAPNLGVYGYERATSPQLDRWAASGVVFERAVATAPWTLPSHATMFTGLYNYAVGTSFTQPMDARHPTLAERLASNGYATAAFVGNLSYASRASGLQRGFARYSDFPVTPAMFTRSAWLPGQLSGAVTRLTGVGGWEVPRRGESVTREFEAWLDGRPDRPFFVFLNYFDAHDPYDPPPPYRGRFGPPPEHELSEDRRYTTAELGPWIDAYDAAITYVDDQLARIFALLEAGGLRDNTLIVVTSDHGEMFGERGQIQHTSGLYMPALHVPLILSLPGIVPGGLRVSRPVTLRDLPATLMDVVGLAGDGVIPGASLAPLWRAERTTYSGSPLLAELDFQGGVAAWKPINRGHMKSLVEGSLHYIHNGNGVEELFDAVADPAATDDLANRAELRPSIERFRMMLAEMFDGMDGRAAGSGPGQGMEGARDRED